MGNLLQYMYAKTVITDKVLTKLLQLKWCSFFASHTGQVVHIRSAVIGSLSGARRSPAAARRILVHFSFRLDIANHSLFVSRRLLEEHGKTYSKSPFHFWGDKVIGIPISPNIGETCPLSLFYLFIKQFHKNTWQLTTHEQDRQGWLSTHSDPIKEKNTTVVRPVYMHVDV